MPFQKGDRNINRIGQNKNLYSGLLRAQITEYCERETKYFLSEIKSMRTGHAKAQAFIALLNFCLPKLTETNSVLDIEKLSSEQISFLLEELKKNKT